MKNRSFLALSGLFLLLTTTACSTKSQNSKMQHVKLEIKSSIVNCTKQVKDSDKPSNRCPIGWHESTK